MGDRAGGATDRGRSAGCRGGHTVRSLDALLSELRGLDVSIALAGDQLKLRAPKGALTPALTAELQARKPQIIEYLHRAGERASQAQGSWLIGRAPAGPQRLSVWQQRFWFLDQLDGSSPAFNMPMAIRLNGPLDRHALERAFDEIVRRHAVLRGNVVVDGDDAVLVTRPPTNSGCVYRDALPADQSARDVMRAAAARRFDLATDPLIRVALYREAGTSSHLLLVTMHHIVSDGWSLGILFRELAALYEAFVGGQASPLAELPIQYGDYANWQRSGAAESALPAQLEYWKTALRGAPAATNLPVDRPRPAIQTYRGASVSFAIEGDLPRRLRERCAEHDVTMFMGLLAGIVILLARHSGQDDVVVGTSVANRRPETEPLIGLFVNTLALRVSVAGDPSVRELLSRVREVCLGAYERQEVPFEQVIDAVKPPRDLSRAPLFQVTFDIQEDAAAGMSMGGVEFVPLQQEAVSSKTDLGFSIEPSADRLTGTLSFNPDLFDAVTIERMASHFRTVLAELVERPDARVSHLRLMSAPEHEQVVHGWNRTEREYPAAKTLPELIDQQAIATPEQVAVIAAGRRLTYAQLSARSNQLARYLRSLSVARESLVAIAVDRSPDLIVGLLAILKAGGAYVPIEPSYPKSRIAGMFADAQPAVIVTHTAILSELPKSDARPVCLDRLSDDLDRLSTAPLPDGPVPDGLAYVIYTSGSTGTPKGVQVAHRPLVNFLNSMRREPGLSSRDTLLAVTTISFDIAGLELYLPLMVGGTVVIADRETAMDPQRLGAAITEHGASFVQATPATWRMLIDSGWSPAGRLRIASGGEALPNALAERLVATGLEVWNLYGPTETTIWSAARKVGRIADTPRDGDDPIGPPIDNTQLYVLDANLSPQPVGVPGELYIGGDGLARGYLNRPDLTADRYRPDPFSSAPGARVYRTGDLVRRLSTGMIEFLGRVDNQVKIRGFRVELGEIEWALSMHDEVRQAVVVARPDGVGERQLVAYVVKGAGPLNAEQLRPFLKLRLPEFMVPPVIVMLDALPLTPNGKIDRHALPAPDRTRPALRAVFQAPRNPTEQQIADIWKTTLEIDRVGIDDNFFDLGGHSLLLTRVHARLRSTMAAPVSLVELFQYPTVRTLAARVMPADVAVAPRRGPGPDADQRRDIAIVGLAGRFPGADDLETFWKNLCEGRETLSCFSDEELIEAGIEPELLSDPNYVRVNGVLSDITAFDAAFFGISPAEARVMDPQHRLFLESCWHVLEHAGYGAGAGEDAVGVFAACSHDRYLIYNLLPHLYTESPHSVYQVMLGNDRDYLASRASYLLNLRGPAVNVQTACSSSLVAVHMACQSILDGDSDLAIAGGVALKVPQRSGYLYSEGMIVSPDGHCRPFDAKANGTTWGSGIGVVLLKSLSRAIEDRDTIYAVVKGSAINNDGSLKVGFTAPGVDGQARVIAAAHQAAGVAPASITYVEAHGTGTPMGDPAEVAALSRAFGSGHQTPYCALGAVKANIGHLDTAAGIAGLIKTTLALQHRQLPPTVHYATANRDIDFGSSPFFVNDRLRDWQPEGGQPLRAGVSSFGIGGTNAHVVLESAPVAPPSPTSGDAALIVCSARTEAARDRLVDSLADFFAGHPDVEIGDAAFTQAAGRARFPHRAAVVCSSSRDAQAALRDPKRVLRGTALPAGGDVVFMFPGQGSQEPGMGSGLHRDEAVFRDTFNQCAELLTPLVGVDLNVALEAGSGSRTAEQLSETWLTQPALFATQYALAQLWMSWGIKPAAMIGHSIGEYVAACLAGVFDLPTACTLVAVRGKVMWQQPRGAMLAVSMPLGQLQRRLPAGLSIAAINAPDACVVAGAEVAIDAFAAQLGDDVAHRKLKTSHAFHSAMMDGVMAPFAAVLAGCTFNRPMTPFISNVSGTWADADLVTKPEYWATHARQAVRFADGMRELLTDPRRVFLEVGAGTTLARIVRRQPSASRSQVVVSSLAPWPDRDTVPTRHSERARVSHALGQLWMAGVDVDWTRYFDGQHRRRIALPLYPFAPERHWVDPPDRAVRSSDAPMAASLKQPLDRWFYLPSWGTSLAPARLGSGALGDHRWLVLTNGSTLGDRLRDRLAVERQPCVCVAEGDAIATVDLSGITDIVHLWTCEHGEVADPDARRRGYDSLITLGQMLANRDTSSPVTVTVVSTQLHDPSGTGDVNPYHALMMGPCLAIPQEHAELTFRTIDVGANAMAWPVEALLAEIIGGAADPHVAYRGRTRCVPRFERVELPVDADPATTLRDRGVYVITGGHGKVGVHLAELLFDLCGARIALLSRRAASTPAVQALQSRGAEILSIAADVSNASDMQAAVQSVKDRFGALHGVIHAAGTLDHPSFACFIESLDGDVSTAQFRPKVDGVQVLDRVLEHEPLDFCILISSSSAVLGGLGFAAYGAANRFMDAYAARCNRRGGTPWLSINWDTWSFERSTPARELSMLPAESREAFRRILARLPAGQLVVGTGDVTARFDRWVRRSDWQASGIQAHTQKTHRRPATAGRIIDASTASERALVGIWKELFGFSDVSVDDDFFALGGDSLSGIRLMAMIKDAVGRKLPLNALLEEPTIRALAAQLDRGEDTAPWSPIVPIAPIGSKGAFYCVPGTGGSVVYLRELAAALAEHGRPFYAFQAAGLDGRTPTADSVEAIAATNVAALLGFQPSGPFFLGGHSFGSWVALEMAHQLIRQGHDVAMLGILDTAAPADRDLSAASVRNDTEWLEVVGDQFSRMFGTQVDLGLDSLAPLDWPAKVERFAQVMIDSGVMPAGADRAEIRGFVNVYRAQAQMRYRPSPGAPPVNLVLLRATEALADFVDGIPPAMKADDTWGWREYALGRAAVETVPGDHLTMMTRPHCHALAAALHRQLTSVEGAGATAAAGNRS
ncbi:MAG: amino acid adenylation domain-containing protein [Acidimicrobiia bacterium]|nr:amino acid adenylation domain-containing protein [Acidimicrobiia bacterium]